MSTHLNQRFATGARMTFYKKSILLIVGILCAFPTYTMHDKADEQSKQLLDMVFYHTHESNEEVLKTILANKGNPNIKDTNTGHTLLHYAALHNNLKCNISSFRCRSSS